MRSLTPVLLVTLLLISVFTPVSTLAESGGSVLVYEYTDKHRVKWLFYEDHITVVYENDNMSIYYYIGKDKVIEIPIGNLFKGMGFQKTIKKIVREMYPVKGTSSYVQVIDENTIKQAIIMDDGTTIEHTIKLAESSPYAKIITVIKNYDKNGWKYFSYKPVSSNVQQEGFVIRGKKIFFSYIDVAIQHMKGGKIKFVRQSDQLLVNQLKQLFKQQGINPHKIKSFKKLLKHARALQLKALRNLKLAYNLKDYGIILDISENNGTVIIDPEVGVSSGSENYPAYQFNATTTLFENGIDGHWPPLTGSATDTFQLKLAKPIYLESLTMNFRVEAYTVGSVTIELKDSNGQVIASTSRSLDNSAGGSASMGFYVTLQVDKVLPQGTYTITISRTDASTGIDYDPPQLPDYIEEITPIGSDAYGTYYPYLKLVGGAPIEYIATRYWTAYSDDNTSYMYVMPDVQTETYTPITITEQSGTDLTDYTVKITLDQNWDGWDYVASDGSDIYVTDENGNPLYYWIESFDYTNKQATIWVKVPNIPASGSITIRLYYGGTNPYSNYNDPNNVFLLFDDFNDGVIPTSYTVITTTNAQVSEADGYLTITTSSADTYGGGWLLIPFDQSFTSIIMETRVYTTAYDGSGEPDIVIGTADSDYQLWSYYSMPYYSSFNAELKRYPAASIYGGIKEYADSTSLTSVSGTTAFSYLSGVWWDASFSIDLNAGQVHLYAINDQGEVIDLSKTISSASAHDFAYIFLGKADHQTSATTYFDWVLVRNYVNPEPSVTIGSSQTGGLLYVMVYGGETLVTGTYTLVDEINSYQIVTTDGNASFNTTAFNRIVDLTVDHGNDYYGWGQTITVTVTAQDEYGNPLYTNITCWAGTVTSTSDTEPTSVIFNETKETDPSTGKAVFQITAPSEDKILVIQAETVGGVKHHYVKVTDIGYLIDNNIDYTAEGYVNETTTWKITPYYTIDGLRVTWAGPTSITEPVTPLSDFVITMDYGSFTTNTITVPSDTVGEHTVTLVSITDNTIGYTKTFNDVYTYTIKAFPEVSLDAPDTLYVDKSNTLTIIANDPEGYTDIQSLTLTIDSATITFNSTSLVSEDDPDNHVSVTSYSITQYNGTALMYTITIMPYKNITSETISVYAKDPYRQSSTVESTTNYVATLVLDTHSVYLDPEPWIPLLDYYANDTDYSVWFAVNTNSTQTTTMYVKAPSLDFYRLLHNGTEYTDYLYNDTTHILQVNNVNDTAYFTIYYTIPSTTTTTSTSGGGGGGGGAVIINNNYGSPEPQEITPRTTSIDISKARTGLFIIILAVIGVALSQYDTSVRALWEKRRKQTKTKIKWKKVKAWWE